MAVGLRYSKHAPVRGSLAVIAKKNRTIRIPLQKQVGVKPASSQT